MKTNKKLNLYIFAGISVFLGVRALSVWPQYSSDLELPTQPISEHQSIGGSIADTKREKNTSGESPINQTVAKKTTPRQRAPKQVAIADTIAKEFEYRALLTSNDPLTSTSWALDAVNASSGWNTSTGNGVVVAVIDSGFGLNHEDLQSQWYQNTGETGTTSSGDTCWSGSAQNKANNNCDDDGNGYVDDWQGWSFIHTDNNPQAGRSNPIGAGVSHGTEVSGIVGAAGNNGKGIATISWNNEIMPLQVLSDSGIGYTSDVVGAIYYAVDNGASVINMSLGGDSVDPAMQAALAYAYNNNVVVVAAAGNCGTGTEYGCDPANPGAMSYPAIDPTVISVGASTNGNERASFSSYGANLDVVAPGSGNIRSTVWTESNGTNAYVTNLYGTSFASPFVASLAGLIKSIRPNTSVNDVRALIDASAQKIGAMGSNWYTNQYGHGLIDVSTALTVANTLQTTPPSQLPTLYQTANHKTEHRYSSNTSLTSGCELAEQTYCTIYAVDSSSSLIRYLPYELTDTNFAASWDYKGSLFPAGGWRLYAQSGEKESSSGHWMIQK